MVLGSAAGLDDCGLYAVPGDTVLLAGAGVTLLAGSLPGLDHGIQLVALQADVSARGLERRARTAGVPLIEDREWVKLVISHVHTMSWQ